MLCILKKIRKKNRILAKTNEKKVQIKRDLQKLRIFFMIFSSSYRLYANNSLSLSDFQHYMLYKIKTVTSVKVHVRRWLFINNSADVSYTLSPMFRSRMKRKSVKEIDVRCRKSVKCVFFAVPDGNSYFLYNIFLRGKICNSG